MVQQQYVRYALSYLTESFTNATYAQAQYNLRNPQLALVQARTVRYRNSPLPTAIRHWNTLPVSLRNSLTVLNFKIKYKNIYMKKKNTLYNYGTKLENKTLSRLRMNFPPLNSYLFARQLVAGSACTCGDRNETIDHYLRKCPLYAAPRTELLRGTVELLRPYDIQLPNNINLTNKLLFGFEDLSMNMALHRLLINFVSATGRFTENV